VQITALRPQVRLFFLSDNSRKETDKECRAPGTKFRSTRSATLRRKRRADSARVLSRLQRDPQGVRHLQYAALKSGSSASARALAPLGHAAL
jgi:hypothetical protein